MFTITAERYGIAAAADKFCFPQSTIDFLYTWGFDEVLSWFMDEIKFPFKISSNVICNHNTKVDKEFLISLIECDAIVVDDALITGFDYSIKEDLFGVFKEYYLNSSNGSANRGLSNILKASRTPSEFISNYTTGSNSCVYSHASIVSMSQEEYYQEFL
ncbi:MAG: hypothetical protein CMK92_05725 [Pseudomonas sp.]|nr:hypothetical protein [Pseudomonas sp.]